MEKDGCQAFRTRKHYIQIFFLDDSIGIFVRYTRLKNNIGTHIPLCNSGYDFEIMFYKDFSIIKQ